MLRDIAHQGARVQRDNIDIDRDEYKIKKKESTING